MDIQIDSREKQKAIQKILKEFDTQGINYFSSKLLVGDYMNLDNPRLIIDRKQNLSEICSNVTQQHERFKAELIRANQANIDLVFLIEHGGKITRERRPVAGARLLVAARRSGGEKGRENEEEFDVYSKKFGKSHGSKTEWKEFCCCRQPAVRNGFCWQKLKTGWRQKVKHNQLRILNRAHDNLMKPAAA